MDKIAPMDAVSRGNGSYSQFTRASGLQPSGDKEDIPKEEQIESGVLLAWSNRNTGVTFTS